MVNTNLTIGLNALTEAGLSPQQFMDMTRWKQSRIPRIGSKVSLELREYFWGKGIYPEKVSLILSAVKVGEVVKVKETLKGIYLEP